MGSDQRLPTLRAFPDQIAPYVLVVGDPERAERAARLMEKAEEVGNFREYRTFTGIYKGKAITVSSHGVGSSGASMCFHELFRCSINTVIRAGTCGAMLEDIHDGDLIIGTGAIREDGASEHLAPMSLPAIADRHVIRALETACAANGIHDPKLGLILTQAYFYPGMLPNELDTWLPTGLAAAVEMEYATLLVMATLHKARSGGIFVSDGNLVRAPDPNAYNPHRDIVEEGKARMLRVALDALADLQGPETKE